MVARVQYPVSIALPPLEAGVACHWADTVLMARLEVLPSQDIISGMKGKVDFYLWHGIPVARKWPRSPGSKRSAAVEAQWPAFADAARLWSELSDDIQAAYREMAGGSGKSGRDVFTQSYLKDIYGYPL